jgi:hypothetical protein
MRELSLDTYNMLPKAFLCPRCEKPGFLTLRWVRSNHYCKIEIPNYKTQWVWKEIPNPLVGKGHERTILVKRNLRRYSPSWHLYIGHYDAGKYKEAMTKYKMGRLKSRPNGRQWHKVRYSQVKGQAKSDLEILMAKYNFSHLDIMKEIHEKSEDMRLKYGIF